MQQKVSKFHFGDAQVAAVVGGVRGRGNWILGQQCQRLIGAKTNVRCNAKPRARVFVSLGCEVTQKVMSGGRDMLHIHFARNALYVILRLPQCLPMIFSLMCFVVLPSFRVSYGRRRPTRDSSPTNYAVSRKQPIDPIIISTHFFSPRYIMD